jgi:hypothetical protein
MTRVFSLVLVLSALALAGYLYATQVRSEGPTAPSVTQAVTQAQSAAASANFQGVAAALQAWFVEHATYAGAPLPPGSGVVLVRADANGYCLQTEAATAVEHELGPGGQPQPGPC